MACINNTQTPGSSELRRINYGCEPISGNSCTFPTTPVKKKEKHTMYYCPHQTKCALCNITGISRERHYLQEHPYDETVGDIEINPVQGVHKWFTLKEDFGRVFCRYWFKNDTFEFSVLTPFNKVELKQYECLFGFHSGPVAKKYVNLYITKRMTDWELTIPMHNFLEYSDHFKTYIFVSFRRKT